MSTVCPTGPAAHRAARIEVFRYGAPPTLEDSLEALRCDACVECVYTGGAWHAHTCGLQNVEIMQEGT